MTPGSAFVLGIVCTIVFLVVASVFLSAYGDKPDDRDEEYRPSNRRGYGEF